MKMIYRVDISSTEERIPKNITIKLRPEGKVGNWQAEGNRMHNDPEE